ncbi:unnamed protein product [Rotaria sp. Silwood1]|nr:unnamed protein product [Rotaria sp. Silwood1]CAF1580920.1 unnamed protein product [Rotaria sp. Silwood1]
MFSQEEFIGAVSKYKHGSSFWGDQIVFYLNIDFALKNIHQNEDPSSSISTSDGLFDITSAPEELIEILPNIHQRFCNCSNVNNCMKFYQRFRNKQQIVYHSLEYTKKQSSVSYFIKYGSLFGIVIVFMSCNDKQYAVVKRHPIKKRFSDFF